MSKKKLFFGLWMTPKLGYITLKTKAKVRCAGSAVKSTHLTFKKFTTFDWPAALINYCTDH